MPSIMGAPLWSTMLASGDGKGAAWDVHDNPHGTGGNVILENKSGQSRQSKTFRCFTHTMIVYDCNLNTQFISQRTNRFPTQIHYWKPRHTTAWRRHCLWPWPCRRRSRFILASRMNHELGENSNFEDVAKRLIETFKTQPNNKRVLKMMPKNHQLHSIILWIHRYLKTQKNKT